MSALATHSHLQRNETSPQGQSASLRGSRLARGAPLSSPSLQWGARGLQTSASWGLAGALGLGAAGSRQSRDLASPLCLF